jgi:hypothetical protein
VLAGLSPLADAREVRTIDPSGVWQSQTGELSLMLSGDALSFSYSAVFGAAAHLCDGAGVAGLAGENEYHYADEQGTVAFVVTARGVSLRPVQGVPSFCGANWPGEEFGRESFKAVELRQVKVPQAHFYEVGGLPPRQRPAYVIRGDRLEVVPVQGEGRNTWVLARFRGNRGVTAGLLKNAALKE